VFSHCDELLGFIQFCGSTKALGYCKESLGYDEYVKVGSVSRVFRGQGTFFDPINQYEVVLQDFEASRFFHYLNSFNYIQTAGWRLSNTHANNCYLIMSLIYFFIN